jgi:hypothetical protein
MAEHSSSQHHHESRPDFGHDLRSVPKSEERPFIRPRALASADTLC